MVFKYNKGKNMIHSKLNKFRSCLVLIAALASFVSCSSAKTKKECEETNYYEMGLHDGEAGKSAERLQRLTVECANLGVEAAAPQYGYGRQAGLQKYCNVDRARADAKSGKSDSMCWNEAVPAYQTAYREALSKRQQDKRADLRNLEESQVKAQKKNGEIQSELQQIEMQKAVH